MCCKISLWTNKYGHCKIRQKHLIITIWSFYGGKVKQLKRDNKCVYRYCNIVLLQSANLSENCSHCTPLWFCIYLIIVYQHLLSIPVNIKKHLENLYSGNAFLWCPLPPTRRPTPRPSPGFRSSVASVRQPEILVTMIYVIPSTDTQLYFDNRRVQS